MEQFTDQDGRRISSDLAINCTAVAGPCVAILGHSSMGGWGFFGNE